MQSEGTGTADRASGARPRAGRATQSDGESARRPRDITWSRAMFYSHLWFGVLFTIVLLVIGITGILLNHKRGLGLMPEVEHSPSGAFSEALPLAELARAAFDAAGVPHDAARIDRMDVRPRNGLVKIRFRDEASTEVTVDINSSAVLHVGPRGDVFMEKLHSGEIFGENGILLSDAGAVGLIVLLISGYWLWLRPRIRR